MEPALIILKTSNMKKTFLYTSLIALMAFSLGCDKDGGEIATYQMVPGSKALLKVNYASAYSSNPSVQLEINGVRMSGLITARTPFPGGGLNTGGSNFPDYLPVDPGSISVSAVIPKKGTETDSIVLFNNSVNLVAGKNYTAHVTDTAANTKVVLLEDDISQPDTGTVRYRFVNLMPNVPAVDLYFGTTLVAANVPYLGSSDYFTLNTWGLVSQSWTIRPAGTTTGTAMATYISASSIAARRVFTIFAMGYKDQTSAALKPYVSFLYNR